MNGLYIRRAIKSDVEQISALIQSVMHLFFSEAGGSGADRFIASTKPEAIKAFINRPDVEYWVGSIDGLFCGAVGIRGGKHLQHLFVPPSLHGRGIGKALWLYAKNASNASNASRANEFTVNASTNAVPFYAKLGFIGVGNVQQANGIIYQAMKLN